MTESFAFAIAEGVLGKLGSALIQEVGLAWGVKTELEELKDTLSTIHALLLDAEEKQATNRQISDWLGKLMLVFNQDEYPDFIYTGIVNWVNTLTTYVLKYLTRWIP